MAIVGSGIAGLSLAWHLNRAGHSVVVLEKNGKAEGASVRNFGMIWVVGQADPSLEALAARSHELWQAAAEQMGFWYRRSGSLHLAYEPIEQQVLEEYLSLSGATSERRLISPDEALELCPSIRREGLLGAMHSTTEGAVDPREVVHCAATALSAGGVDVRFDACVTEIQPGMIRLSDGSTVPAKAIALCPGPDIFDQSPVAARDAGLELCHLQMLRLRPKPGTAPLGIHLCAGLTLGHYRNFSKCPSLPELLEVHRRKWPSQVECGIHVLVSEHGDGAITVGDSHAYGRGGPVYQDEHIDEFILEAMDEFLPPNLYDIDQRWIGRYPTHPSHPYWLQQINDGIWALNLFGTGMTLSFGVTEQLSHTIIKNL